MTSCHLIPTWHKWNANAGDIIVIWFASYANLVMPCWACTLHVHIHCAHAIVKNGAPKYLSSLVVMQADLNLGKLTASHSQELNTQNANKNIPDMFPIAYLNENLRYCNENSSWGKQEPLVHPYVFCTQQKVRKQQKLHFILFSCRYHNFQNIPNYILLEYQHTTPVECC